MATSHLDDPFLLFNTSGTSIGVLMTATQAGFLLTTDSSQTSTTRPPIVPTVAGSVPFLKIDSYNNVYMSSVYKSATAVPLYNQTGSLSSKTLPGSTYKTPFIIKFDKYGQVSSYSVVFMSTETSVVPSTSMSIDKNNNLYFASIYSGTAIVSNFESITSVFNLPQVSTDSTFVIKYSPATTSTMTATAWTYIQPSTSSNVNCSTIDCYNFYYLSGSYSGSAAAYNFTSTASVGSTVATLPTTGFTATTSSYILKYSNDMFNGFTIIAGQTANAVVTTNSAVTDIAGSIYVNGFVSANALAYTYDFSGSNTLSTQIILGSNTSSSAFVVKYNTYGTYTLTNLVENTTSVGPLAIDSKDNLYCTGSYSNTNPTNVYGNVQAIRSTFSQIGPRTVSSGTGGGGSANGGNQFSLSADGSTVLISDRTANGTVGGFFVFVRNNVTNAYEQQGPRIVPTGYSSINVAFGGSFAGISGDGNTFAACNYSDIDTNTGSTWIFVRSGSNWSQQGSKIAAPSAGASVGGSGNGGVSYDGNTVAVGYNSGAQILVRNGTTWSSQAVLVTSAQGFVSMSGDGNNVIVGDKSDNGGIGRGTVFTRSVSTWSSQAVLVATGYSGTPNVGSWCSMSDDGNTVAMVGQLDNTNGTNQAGSTFIFVKSGSSWSQQGLSKLVASGVNSSSTPRVFLSGNGNVLAWATTALTGPVYVFTRNGNLSNNAIWSQTPVTPSGSVASSTFYPSISSDGNNIGVYNYNDSTPAFFILVNNSITYQIPSYLTSTSTTNPVSLSSISSQLPATPTTLGQNTYLLRWATQSQSQTPVMSLTGMTIIQNSTCGSLTVANDNVYLSGQYTSTSASSVIPVYDFYNGSSATFSSGWTSSFYLPTLANTTNTFLVKYSTVTSVSTTTALLPNLSVTGLTTLFSSTNPVLSASETNSTLVADTLGSVYLGLSAFNANALAIKDIGTTQGSTSPLALTTTRYSFTSNVSNTAFYVKWTTDGLATFASPTTYTRLTNIQDPVSASDAATKSYIDGTFEYISASNSSVSTDSSVTSIITPTLTTDSNRTIQTIFDGQLDETGLSVAIDNTNEVIYLGGLYNTTNPVAVYNRDGTYAGFNIPRVNISANPDIYILKYNFSGQALSWTVIVGIGGSDTIGPTSLAVFNGSLYVSGSIGTTGPFPIYNFSTNSFTGASPFSIPTVAGQGAFILIYSPTGIASKWTTLDNGTSTKNESFSSIALDTNGTLYATGQMFCSNTVNVYNFSTTNALGTTPFSIPATAAATTANTMVLIKWSNVGTATGWTRLLGPQTTSTSVGSTVICDSLNNVYCSGYYTETSGVYNFMGTGGAVFSGTNAVFALPAANSDDAYIIKWTAAGSVVSATVLSSLLSDRSLSIATDQQNNLYCSGFYTDTVAVNNFTSTTGSFTSPFVLPKPPIGSSAFLVKWSSLGTPVGMTVLQTNSTSSGLFTKTSFDSSVYLTGFYAQSTTAVPVYNFYTGPSAAFSSGWVTPFSLPITTTNTLGQDAFIIKWTSDGTAAAWTMVPDTAVGQGSSLDIDRTGSLHCVGSYSSTSTVGLVPIYNMSSTIPAGTTRYSLGTNTSASAAFYIKYLSNGSSDLGRYLETFYVNVPDLLTTSGTSSLTVSTDSVKKTLILKSINYRYVIYFSGTSYTYEVFQPTKVNMLWMDGSWFVV